MYIRILIREKRVRIIMGTGGWGFIDSDVGTVPDNEPHTLYVRYHTCVLSFLHPYPSYLIAPPLLEILHFTHSSSNFLPIIPRIYPFHHILSPNPQLLNPKITSFELFNSILFLFHQSLIICAVTTTKIIAMAAFAWVIVFYFQLWNPSPSNPLFNSYSE